MTWPYPNNYQTIIFLQKHATCHVNIQSNNTLYKKKKKKNQQLLIILNSHFLQIFWLHCITNMASMTLNTIIPNVTISNNTKHSFGGLTTVPCNKIHNNNNNQKRSSSVVVSAVGDVSSDGTIYLVAGAIGIALVGTAFPIIFSRKDT